MSITAVYYCYLHRFSEYLLYSVFLCNNMPPIGTRTVFIEETNSAGNPMQKFGRTNMYSNKIVHTVGVSQNTDKFSVVQMVQNNDGNLYKRQFVLPESEIMKLLKMPDVLVPLEGVTKTDVKKRTVYKKPVPKKTTKKTAKKTAKKTVPKKTVKKAVAKKTVAKKTVVKKKSAPKKRKTVKKVVRKTKKSKK